MGIVGTVAALVVGAVLVAAGVFKLADGPGWPRRAADMRVPAVVARTVPFVEIVVGAALAAQLAEPWPALVAVALLVVFTIVIGVRLLDGSRPPCACFGSHSTRPIGPYHVVRNVVLVVLAITAAAGA